MRRSPALALALLAALTGVGGLAGCGSSERAGDGRPLVVATTTQVADFARVLGGDDVEVYGILKPNVDAHDVEPTPADLDALARADAIVANGLGLEPWLDDAVTASGTDVEVTDTSEGAHLIAGDHQHEDEAAAEEAGHDHEGEWNPHLWFDPANAQVMVANVADALVAAAPDAADAIRAREAAYDGQLEELDGWIADQIATLDEPELVTDHDAFPYYVERFGIDFVGSIIPSFDSAAEVSTKDLDDLAAEIERTGVRAIFTEQALPPKAAEALARKVDVEVVTGDDGLYGDSLGPEGSAGATYLEMMRHNTSTIVEHLQ